MITRITAEFDSIDTAERAARLIKEATSGIENISISAAKRPIDKFLEYEIPETNNFFPLFNNNAAGGMAVNGEYQDGVYADIPQRSIIEVLCEKTAEHTVTGIFTALGGLNVNKF